MRLWDDPLTVTGRVIGVVFSPDGKTIAAGYNVGGRGGLVLFDVDLRSWQRIAGRIANRNLTKGEWSQYFPDDKPYHRTFRNLPWPSDLPDSERIKSEQIEQKNPSPEEVPIR
jgi:hypothetical protein